MDLRQYANIFRRWLWLIILGTLIAALGGYFLSARQPQVYQANTRFMILRAAPTSFDYFYIENNQELISTYVQLLTTDTLLDRASQKLGYSVYENQAQAQQVADTQFATLTVRDEDPAQAVEIANVLISTLIETNDEMQAIRFLTAEQNLQQRINETQVEIDTIQQQIRDMSTTEVQSQIDDVQGRIDDLQRQITQLEARNSELLGILMPSDEQKTELASIQDSLDQLKPILDMYQQIYTNLVVLGEPLEGSSDSLSRLNQLQTTLGLYQQIYIASVSDMEALRLSRAQSTPTIVQVEKALALPKPVAPKPFQTALLAAAVGLILTGGIAFLIEYLDDTIKTPDEINERFGLPVIGMVADMQAGKKSNGKGMPRTGLFVARQPRSPVSEAFRSMRTNLEFASIDRPLRILMITSANPEEGKTTISVNLAVILSQGDRKVLLLDGDMRRPKIHQHLEISNRVGLSDLIRGKLRFDDVVQEPAAIKGLKVITSGSLPPNPAELLGSNRMLEVLEELKKQFEIIIIDAPPMVVSDSLILSKKVDGLIFTVQPGRSRLANVRTAISELNRLEARVIGVVFNRIPKSREFYYSGYSYYHTSAKKAGDHYYTETQL